MTDRNDSCEAIYRLMKVARKKMQEYDCNFGSDELNKLYSECIQQTQETFPNVSNLVDETYKEDEDIFSNNAQSSEQDINEIIKRSYEDITQIENMIKKRVIQLTLIPQIKKTLISIDEVNNCLYETNSIHLTYCDLLKKLEKMRREKQQRKKQIERRYDFRKRSLQRTYEEKKQKQISIYNEI